MKKFMLGVMMLFAYGKAMAMDDAKPLAILNANVVMDTALTALRERIEASAIRSAEISENNTLGFYGEIRAAKARDVWKKVYTAHAFSQMKNGEPVSKFLVDETTNINNKTGMVWDKFSREWNKNGVYERTGESSCKSTLDEEMEKDWQEICRMVANGHFVLTKKDPASQSDNK